MTYRLIILAATVLAVACSPSSAPPEAIEPIQLLVGTYTGEGSEGVYRLNFDTETGSLGDPALVAKTESPSFLQWSDDHTIAYVATRDSAQGIITYRWNAEGTQLEPISAYPSYGKATCHIDVSPDGSYVAAANYMTGNVVVYKVSAEGVLDPNPEIRQHEGTGPNAERQEGPHAHYSRFSQDGKYLYVVDLGIDQVIKYSITADGLGNGEIALELDPGDGPRHFDFHPNKKWVFILNELTATVTSASIQEDGSFIKLDKASTHPEGYDGHKQSADIHVSSDGNFLYASNRGHNSIAIFSISDSGKLELLSNEPVQGDWPRNFALSPDERFLLVANRRSNNIVVFSRDAQTGLLSYTGNQIELSQPVCLKF